MDLNESEDEFVLTADDEYWVGLGAELSGSADTNEVVTQDEKARAVHTAKSIGTDDFTVDLVGPSVNNLGIVMRSLVDSMAGSSRFPQMIRPKHIATIGDGVYTAPSRTIPGAPRGLFADQYFYSKEYITKYEPDPNVHGQNTNLTFEQAVALPGPQTHMGAHQGVFVSGLRDPVQGLGGGQFANDPSTRERKGTFNAEIVRGDDAFGNELYLRVKEGKKIAPGEEIFVTYGSAGTRKQEPSKSWKVAMGVERWELDPRDLRE